MQINIGSSLQKINYLSSASWAVLVVLSSMEQPPLIDVPFPSPTEERWKELVPRSELQRSDTNRVWCTTNRLVVEGGQVAPAVLLLSNLAR